MIFPWIQKLILDKIGKYGSKCVLEKLNRDTQTGENIKCVESGNLSLVPIMPTEAQRDKLTNSIGITMDNSEIIFEFQLVPENGNLTEAIIVFWGQGSNKMI